MKKISIISILSVLVLPAFAQIKTEDLYGDPANIQQAKNADVSQVAEQQLDTQPVKEQPVDSKDMPVQKIEEQKNIEQTAEKTKVEEKKTVKQTKKTSSAKEKEVQQEQQIESAKAQEQKFETKAASNPNAKFPNGLQFGLGVSPTSGLNAFVGYNNKKFDSFWWKRFGLRLDFATYSPIKNRLNREINDAIGDDGIKIDDDLKIDNVNISAKHIGALVDFYPFGDTWFLGGLRVSGGYMTGNMKIDADIKGTKNVGEIKFKLGDREYAYTGDQMHGKTNVNWEYRGPYLGTGFDFGILYGFKIYLDAGVVFTNNNARADLNVPLTDLKDLTADLPVEGNALLENAYNTAKAQALKKAQDELDKVDYFPIVKLGFMYRF